MIFLKAGGAEYGNTGADKMKRTETFDELRKNLPGEPQLISAAPRSLKIDGLFCGYDPLCFFHIYKGDIMTNCKLQRFEERICVLSGIGWSSSNIYQI
jgi:hypothetical protein